MSFHQVFDFLRDLNKNNSKIWMDEHRDRYHEARDFVLDWIENLDKRLQKIDPGYMPTPAKKAISRLIIIWCTNPTLPLTAITSGPR